MCDEDDGMPCTVCYECASRLDKFRIFRKRSRRAHVVLRGLLEEHDELTVTSLRKVDRTQQGLESSLVCCNLKPIIIEPTIENSSDFEFKLDHVESISNESEFSESEAEIKPVDFEVKREACSPEPSVDNLDYYVSFLPGPKQEDHIPEPEKNTRKQKKRLPKRDNAASEKEKVKNVEKAAPKRKRITRNGPNESSGTGDDDPKKVKRVRKVKNKNGEEITPRKKRTKIASTLKSDGTNAEVTIKPKRSRARPGARQHTLYSAEYYNNFATVTVMSEEEQMEFFRQRQDTERYKMATYKCTDCFLPFACQEAYHTHRKRHDDPSEGQEVCNICKVRLKDVPLLKKHIAMNHRTKFECRKCTHVCASSMSARVHESTHADKTYPCTECGLEFKRLMSYNQHVYKTHPSYVACPVCGDTFLGQGAVNKHRAKTHSGVADADCKVMCECRVLFYSDEAYSAHRQSYPQHTDGKNGLISCEFCEEKFPNLEAAQEHRKTHKQAYIDATGGVECEQCGKVLSTNREYSRHFRWSHPDKTRTKYPLNRSAHYVMCELCGRVCQSFAMYRDHIKIYHQGEKPYKCDVCHKGFITSYARKEHRRVHTKEQPYQCTVCNRAFTSYSNLQRHKSVHTDETPFSCEVCGKCFKFRYTVKYHIQYVHLKKPWPKRDRSKRTQKRTEAERELAALME